jgi:hypothetical protein
MFSKPKNQKPRLFYPGKDPVFPRNPKQAEPFQEKIDITERKQQQNWPVSIDTDWKD